MLIHIHKCPNIRIAIFELLILYISTIIFNVVLQTIYHSGQINSAVVETSFS